MEGLPLGSFVVPSSWALCHFAGVFSKSETESGKQAKTLLVTTRKAKRGGNPFLKSNKLQTELSEVETQPFIVYKKVWCVCK